MRRKDSHVRRKLATQLVVWKRVGDEFIGGMNRADLRQSERKIRRYRGGRGVMNQNYIYCRAPYSIMFNLFNGFLYHTNTVQVQKYVYAVSKPKH